MMACYALTGGIATGKSSFIELVSELLPEAVVFDADASVKKLLDEPRVIRAVMSVFGHDVLTRSNTINKEKLRALVFSDEHNRKELESILHPKVRQECLDLCEETRSLGTSPLFIADVPLLFENGTFHFGQEHTILVATTRATQIDRLKERNGFDDALCGAILDSQWPIEEKIPLADTVIWNEGPPEVMVSQVRRFLIHHKLMPEDKMTEEEVLATKEAPLKEATTDESVVAEEANVSEEAAEAIKDGTKKSEKISETEEKNPEKKAAQKAEQKEEDTTPVPDGVDLNELRTKSHAELYETASALPIRLTANSNKAQLVYSIITYYLGRGVAVTVEGIMEQGKESYGILKNPLTSFKNAPDDIYVGANIINDYALANGQKLKGTLRPPRNRDKFISMEELLEVEGIPAEDFEEPKPFDKLTSMFPEERFMLERQKDKVFSTRLIDLVAPIGKGQRGLIVAPPRGGKTILLKQIAKSIQENHPNSELIVLLLDERPEEVTDFEDLIADHVNEANVFSSTFDEPNKRHAQVSDLVLERARRQVEMGKDVVILLDSLTRLGRGYNNSQRGGAIGSGGLSPIALQKTRAFFGAARNIEEGGSLTIVATCLVETENRMDDIIFEELKGTGNMEIKLDQEMAEKRIYPAIHIAQSGTRNDDRLYHDDELPRVLDIRRQLAKLPVQDSLMLVLKNIHKTGNNAELLLTGLR